MENKYDFDLILTKEQLKVNQQKVRQQDKDTKWEITLISSLVITLVIVSLLIFHDNKANYNKVKASCEAGQKQIVEYYRYDGEKSWTCK